MSNEYYTPGTAVQPFTTADARDLQAEFASLEAGFDMLPDPDYLNAALGTGGLLGSYYTTRAAGAAALDVGDVFCSDEDEYLKVYQVIVGAPYYEEMGETVDPMTRAEFDIRAFARATANGEMVASFTGASGVARISTSIAASEIALSFDCGNLGYAVRDSIIVGGNNGSNQTYLDFYTSNAAVPAHWLRLGPTGVLQPGSDNAQTLGSGSFRWSVVYAGSGTINTSDERDKEWRGDLTPQEYASGRRMIDSLGFYRWKASVAEKGAQARRHFGIKAQDVARILIEEGVEESSSLPDDAKRRIKDKDKPDFKSAFLCFDTWEALPARPAQPAEYDEAGDLIRPATPAQPGRPAGNSFGLRHDQFTMFLIATQAKQIEALEARIAALEAAA